VTKKLKYLNIKKIHHAILTRRKVENIFSAISGISSRERAEFIPFEPQGLTL